MTTLALIGDVMLGRGVDEALRTLDPERVWGDTLPLLRSADLRVVNLECAITDHERPWACMPEVFHFRADSSAVEVLEEVRVDGCSAGQRPHFGFRGTGSYRHLGAPEGGWYPLRGGRPRRRGGRALSLLKTRPDRAGRVALVAFTDNEPSFAAGSDRPGTDRLPVSLELGVLGRVKAAIAGEREAGAKIVSAPAKALR